jgi:hypothetical protein
MKTFGWNSAFIAYEVTLHIAKYIRTKSHMKLNILTHQPYVHSIAIWHLCLIKKLKFKINMETTNLFKQTCITQNTTAWNQFSQNSTIPLSKLSLSLLLSNFHCNLQSNKLSSQKQRRIKSILLVLHIKVYFIGIIGSFWDTISNSTTENNG